MNWTIIIAVCEIVGAIAVISSLIYLASYSGEIPEY